MKTDMKSNLMLVLTAFIWGVAFVAQSVGMRYVGPFTFNAARFMLGGLVLIPVLAAMRKGRGEPSVADAGKVSAADAGKMCVADAGKMSAADAGKVSGEVGREYFGEGGGAFRRGARTREGIKGGVMCGTALFVASAFQQFGISMTTVGKAGFITALYIVIVPVLRIFMKKRAAAQVWVSVALATVGMYLLCVTEGLRIGRGDLCVLACAFCFSFHILIIDHVSPRSDGVLISCVQFFTAGTLALAFALILEHPDFSVILAAWQPIAYAGVMSCGVAYTLQVVAQKDTDPTVAALLMSLESVFSLLAGWVLLGQRLSARELCGCALVFAAVILAQIPARFAGKVRRRHGN